MAKDKGVKRVPVDFDYACINPDFLKMLAQIGEFAKSKYGAWEQYTGARLVGEKSPINHAYEHLRQYTAGEPYDHFEGDVSRHLAAVAYNCMMEFYFLMRWGHLKHPLVQQQNGEEAKSAGPKIRRARRRKGSGLRAK
jgi:hypothetical protein